jgi:hypothetical protein
MMQVKIVEENENIIFIIFLKYLPSKKSLFFSYSSFILDILFEVASAKRSKKSHTKYPMKNRMSKRINTSN